MNKSDVTVICLLIFAVLLLISQLAMSPMLFAIAFPFVMFLWMWLGAMKKGKVRGGARYSLILVLVIWLVGFIAMVSMDHTKFGTFFGGLPAGTAIMMYFVWFLPFLVGTVVYGIRFEKDYITMDDLKEFCDTTGVDLNELTEVEEAKETK